MRNPFRHDIPASEYLKACREEITRLRQRIEELEAQRPEWVSVDERPICTPFPEDECDRFDINIEGYFLAEIELIGPNAFFIVRVGSDGMLWDMGDCDIGYNWRAVVRWMPFSPPDAARGEVAK